MTREELLKSPEWWLGHIQSDLYGIIEEYRLKHDLKKKDLAEILGVSKGYISQVLNGDYDHKLSKLIELALTFGKVPKLEFVDIDKYIEQDKKTISSQVTQEYKVKVVHIANQVSCQESEIEEDEFWVTEREISTAQLFGKAVGTTNN